MPTNASPPAGTGDGLSAAGTCTLSPWDRALFSRALFVAAKLGIADLLKEGPRDADELAAACQAHAPRSTA